MVKVVLPVLTSFEFDELIINMGIEVDASKYAAFNELDDEIKQEFYEDFYAAVKEINECAEVLESGTDSEVIVRMFRSLHTIKGNCNMVFLNSFVDVSHKLEDLFSNIRSGQIDYHHDYGQFAVTAINVIKEQIKKLLEESFADDMVLSKLEGIIHTIQEADHSDKLAITEKAIIAIEDRHYNLEMVAIDQEEGSAFSFLDATDLEFFQFVANKQYSVDSNYKQLLQICQTMAMKLNAMLGQSIDEEQLKVAVIFLGLSRRVVESTEVKDLVINQVFFASGLLSRMPGWDIAAETVLQCYESFDGSGAPKGLQGDDISPAAQVIGLAFEFSLLVILNSTKGYKESLFVAVKVINAKKDTRYKSRLIDRFNNLIKAEYLNNKMW